MKNQVQYGFFKGLQKIAAVAVFVINAKPGSNAMKSFFVNIWHEAYISEVKRPEQLPIN